MAIVACAGACVAACMRVIVKDDVHKRELHELWSVKAHKLITNVYDDNAKKGQTAAFSYYCYLRIQSIVIDFVF